MRVITRFYKYFFLHTLLEYFDCCTPEVINYIIKKLDEHQQFPYLAIRLGKRMPSVDVSEIEENTNKMNMIRNIPWDVLKNHLEKLGHLDTVEYISKHTSITEGKY